MDWRPKRRQSREYPPNFSQVLQENLCNEAALFIGHFDKHEQRMRQIVEELQMITAKINDRDTAAGSATGLSSAQRETAAEEKDVEKVMNLTAQFRTVVALLNTELETVKTACGELRRESVKHEALNLNHLEMRILQLFAVTAKLSTSIRVQCLTEVCDEYGQIGDEFEKLRTELTHFKEDSQQQ